MIQKLRRCFPAFHPFRRRIDKLFDIPQPRLGFRRYIVLQHLLIAGLLEDFAQNGLMKGRPVTRGE